MEDNKDQNINFLSDGLKKKKNKSSKKVEKNEYAPEMVRPDSEKLKKAKNRNISGSEVSFFQKASDWFGDKFSFSKSKKDEKPRIQEMTTRYYQMKRGMGLPKERMLKNQQKKKKRMF